MIKPGDELYIDEQNRVWSKPRKGRKYFGRSSKANKGDIEEGLKMKDASATNPITKESATEAKKLKEAPFSISTNTVKIPEMRKAKKTISP